MTRTRTLLTVLGAGLVVALPIGESLVHADVPALLTQQGQLIDKTTGAPASGSLSFAFSIYADPAGGTPLWTETQSITLDGGYFSAQLGSTTPLPATVFDGSVRYLGVQIGSDAELAPREALTSVPYAVLAGNVNGDITPKSVSIGGKVVIGSDGTWKGPTAGLAGPPGPKGDPGTSTLTWPAPNTLSFMPTTPSTACGTVAIGGTDFGTVSTPTPTFVATMFWDSSKFGAFPKARLAVVCRGAGTINLVTACPSTTLATITCTGGTRPWTYTSAEFAMPASGSFDISVAATSGSMDWAHPQLILY